MDTDGLQVHTARMTENQSTSSKSSDDDRRGRVEKKVATRNNAFLDFVQEADPDVLNQFMPTDPVRRTERKIGRNEPCPCGSGKKYKKCCG